MIGIIGAMEIEINPLIGQMEDTRAESVSGILFHEGTLFGQHAVLAVSGIGKVAAALCAQTMILHFHADMILNTGVGGSISPALSIGDIAIADRLVQHDMDTTPIGDPPGWINGIDKVFFPCDPRIVSALSESVAAVGGRSLIGAIASGDQFIATAEQKERIDSLFGAVCCEMEGAAIAHACYLNRVPFGVIRTVSDEANGNSAEDFPAFAASSAEIAVRIVTHFLQHFSF